MHDNFPRPVHDKTKFRFVFIVLGDKMDGLYSQIGPTGTSNTGKSVFENENTATLKIILNQKYQKESDQIVLAVEELLGSIPEATISLVRDETTLQSTMGTDEAPLIVEVRGDDPELLQEISSSIRQNLDSLPGLLNVKTSIEGGAPEIEVVIDRFQAGLHGISVDQVVSQLKDRLMGREAGKYEKEGEMNDITIKLPEMSLAAFNTIKLSGTSGEVYLYELAHIHNAYAPRQLMRRNQIRIAQVVADVDDSQSFDKTVSQVRHQLEQIELPANYHLSITGQEQKRQESMASLTFALLLSIVLVYMVMASQFESLLHPFTILLTIPLAVVGPVWAFLLLGKPLSIMAYIGIIMLAGIAVNDSIILVDAINRHKARGMELRDAIILAGEIRIRPIIMTSLTTILALLPLTLGYGESAALRSPMAIAVISGLITSTLLTLVVIPCVYYVFEKVKRSLPGARQ